MSSELLLRPAEILFFHLDYSIGKTTPEKSAGKMTVDIQRIDNDNSSPITD